MIISKRGLFTLLIICLVCVLLFFLFYDYDPAPSKAQWISFSDEAEEGARPVIKLIKSDFESIEINYTFPGVWASDLELAGHRFTYLSGDGYGHPAKQGQPNLPLLRQSLLIPAGAHVTAEVVDAKYKEVKLADLNLKTVSPRQPPRMKTPDVQMPFQYDRYYYKQDRFLPAEPVALENEYFIRGRRLFSTTASAVAYNPAKETLRFYSELTVRLQLTDSDVEDTRKQWIRFYSPDYEVELEEHILNYWPVYDQLHIQQSDILEKLRINYLIIVGDDSFYDPMLPFVALKESEGFTVTMVRLSELVPNAAAMSDVVLKNKIMLQIRNYYYGENSPGHLLLVGNHELIPMWMNDERPHNQSYHVFATDLFYACMDSVPDWHPDIRYGRFPVSDVNELTMLVDKQLTYAALNGNEAWLKRATFAATCDLTHYADVESTHNGIIARSDARGYYGNFPITNNAGGDQLYCQSNSATQNDMKNMLSEGRGYIVVSGHGSRRSWQDFDFEFNEVASNTPEGAFPYISSYACYTGSLIPFNVLEDTLSRSWLMQQNKGAIAFYGPTFWSGWDIDNILERGSYELAFLALPYAKSGYRNTPGRLIEAGQNLVEDIEGEVASFEYRQKYNLLGDPALLLWFQGWTNLLSGHFSEMASVDLLFYDQKRQEVSVFNTDAKGALSNAWRSEVKGGNWTLARRGDFHPDAGDELVMFDNQAGKAGLFKVGDFSGEHLVLMSQLETPGTSWQHFITGDFDDKRDASDFLFLYSDQPATATARSALYVAKQGTLMPLSKEHGLKNGFDLITTGQFRADSAASDLFLYDRDTGTAEMYRINPGGQLQLQASYRDLDKSWDVVVAGDFDPQQPQQELLAYDSESGIANVFSLASPEQLTLLRRYDTVGANWDKLIAGNFGGTTQTDLLFYRNSHGEGRLYLMQENGTLQPGKRTPLTLRDVPQAILN